MVRTIHRFNRAQAQLQESQARERQYQSQLAQANRPPLQEYQKVIEQLQQNGLIRITAADGQIQLGRRGNAFPSQGN